MFYSLDYVAHTNRIPIQHYLNSGGKEKYVPPYRLDGFSPGINGQKPLALENAGCWWHNHDKSVCPITAKLFKKNPELYEARKERLEHLKAKQKQYNQYQTKAGTPPFWAASMQMMVKLF